MIDFVYPVLEVKDCYSEVLVDEQSVTTATAAGIKSGWFHNMLLIDSTGKAVRVRGAKILHGIGRFWGYNILLGRKVRIELIFDGEPFQLSLDEVKRKAHRGLRFYAHGIDPDYWKEQRRKLYSIGSIAEVVQYVQRVLKGDD